MENIEKFGSEDTLAEESFERMQFPTEKDVQENIEKIEELQESFDEIIGSSDYQAAEAYWIDYINSLEYDDLLEDIAMEESGPTIKELVGEDDIFDSGKNVSDTDTGFLKDDTESGKDGLEAESVAEEESSPSIFESDDFGTEESLAIREEPEGTSENGVNREELDAETCKYLDGFIRRMEEISSIADYGEGKGFYLLDYIPFKESLRVFEGVMGKEDIDMELFEKSLIGMTDALTFDVSGEVDGSEDTSSDLNKFVSCANDSIYCLSSIRDLSPDEVGDGLSSLIEALDYKVKEVKRLDRENMERVESNKSIRYMIDSPMDNLLRVLKYVDEEGALFDMRGLRRSVEELSESLIRNDRRETVIALSGMRKSMEMMPSELPPSIDPDEVYRIITQLDDLHYSAVSAASKSMDEVSDNLKEFGNTCWDAMEAINRMKHHALDNQGG